MAKRKTTESTDAAGRTSSGQGNGQGETVAGYFRKVFEENPGWLESRSNDALFARWLKDHPGETAVPEKVRQNLSNVKSVLRKKLRSKPSKSKKQNRPAEPTGTIADAPRRRVRGLDALEEQIDECLTLAKNLDREGLINVISLLRRARNEVVWKMGET